MGSVFLGQDPSGRRVAIKVVHPDLVYDDEFRGRFRSEVNRARQVPPFCTAEVIDADPDHDPPYLVVEYVDGPNLAEVVRRQGPLGGAGLHSMAVGVATALSAIHGAGVIHRDLKPANVLFALGGVKVIDFGIARAFESTSQHTRTDQLIGTVAYMAPERFDAETARQVGPAADIFAWGAVVAYAATGHSPFRGDSPTITMMRILTQPPDLTGLAGPLRDLVERTLSKDPAARPTARELLDHLVGTAPGSSGDAERTRAIVGGGDGRPGRRTARPGAGSPAMAARTTRRRRWLTGLGAAAAVVVLASAVVVGRHLLDLDTATGGDTPGRSTIGPSRSAGTTPTPTGSPTAATEVTAAIMNGKRRIHLYLVEIGQYLSLPFDGVLDVSSGTGSDTLFVLEPAGVDFMIRSLNPDMSHLPCLGVRINPQGSGSLVGAECYPSAATVFRLFRDGGKDGEGRPTYQLINDEYGVVQWSRQNSRMYVEFLGDSTVDTTFSLVDRGAR